MSRSWVLVGSLAVFGVGVFIIFNSVAWGSEAANAYLQSQGGGMDTAQFVIVFQEYIKTYRWMGSILSILGGFGVGKTIEIK